MLLKSEYDVLVRFRNDKEVDKSLLDGYVLTRLVENKLLKYEPILGPNPNPEKMINGKILQKIPVGQNLVISEEGRYALSEFEENAEEKKLNRSNIKKANTIAYIALVTSIISVIASIVIAIFKK